MKDMLIHEVGPRDGLQVEEKIVPIEQKRQWIESMISAGIDIIQVGSFVHPKRVPQMADTDELVKQLLNSDAKRNNEKVMLSGLVLNEKGLERALACGVEFICTGVSASETHSRKNTGMSVDEALERIIAVAKQAKSENKRVQVSVQSAFGCGYEGRIPEEKVLRIVQRYLDAGLTTISLADTSGFAHPEQVKRLFEAIFRLDESIECACHFHNTYGLGLVNCYAAMQMGVKYFESSFGGLGGCPFTKSPSGNVCTEDLVHFLQSLNLRTDINLNQLIEIARDVAKFFGRELPGLVYKIGPSPLLSQPQGTESSRD